MKRKIGKTMKICGICMAILCGSTGAIQAEEVITDCTEVEEIVEEILIEPEMPVEAFPMEEWMIEPEIPVDAPPVEERITEPEDMPQFTDTDVIQEAIDTGTDVTITVNADIMLNSQIIIPSGKRVTFVPADGENVTMFRGEDLCGTFFFVEENGMLILGSEGTENARLTVNGGMDFLTDMAEGAGEVVIRSGAEVKGFYIHAEVDEVNTAQGDIVIGEDGWTWETVDLSETYLELFGAEDLVYNGAPQMPELFVWNGTQMLMKGFDYDVTYQNNVNAGEATVMVTATSMGTCTGTASASFLIAPALPVYEVSDQIVECGIEISQLLTPETGIGVMGEPVEGELVWAATEGGNALPSDMFLSGADGDRMELYWTFYPKEENGNYMPVSGVMTVTFVMPAVPGIGDGDLWGNLNDEVGNLSGGSSSSGVTTGDDISVDLSTEPVTEIPETEVPVTDIIETEEPVTEKPETEEPVTENPETKEPVTEVPETEEKKQNAVVRNPASAAGTSTGTKTGLSVNRTGTAASSGNAVSVSSRTTVKKSNPQTGDATDLAGWILLGLSGLLTGIFVLDTKERIHYNGRR